VRPWLKDGLNEAQVVIILEVFCVVAAEELMVVS